MDGASQCAETSQGSLLSSPGMIKLHGKLESGTALLAVQRGLQRMKEEQRSRAICGHVIFPHQHLLGGNRCNGAWVRANSATFLPPRSCKFNVSDNLLMHFPQSLKTPISHHRAERGLPALLPPQRGETRAGDSLIPCREHHIPFSGGENCGWRNTAHYVQEK